MELLVQEQDVPQFAKMMHDDWMESVQREGTVNTEINAPLAAEAEDGEPPCPACGTAAPLVDGCCSDCGLHLG